jgi:hypothetical protein
MSTFRTYPRRLPSDITRSPLSGSPPQGTGQAGRSPSLRLAHFFEESWTKGPVMRKLFWALAGRPNAGTSERRPPPAMSLDTLIIFASLAFASSLLAAIVHELLLR